MMRHIKNVGSPFRFQYLLVVLACYLTNLRKSLKRTQRAFNLESLLLSIRALSRITAATHGGRTVAVSQELWAVDRVGRTAWRNVTSMEHELGQARVSLEQIDPMGTPPANGAWPGFFLQ